MHMATWCVLCVLGCLLFHFVSLFVFSLADSGAAPSVPFLCSLHFYFVSYVVLVYDEFQISADEQRRLRMVFGFSVCCVCLCALAQCKTAVAVSHYRTSKT